MSKKKILKSILILIWPFETLAHFNCGGLEIKSILFYFRNYYVIPKFFQKWFMHSYKNVSYLVKS